MAGNGGAGLDTGARHIVEHILGCKRPSRCLAMGAQHQRFRVLWVEVPFHQLGP